MLNEKRTRRREARRKKVGLPPGTPVHVGEPAAVEPFISVIRYNGDLQEEREFRDMDECLAFLDERPEGCVTWINIDSVSDVSIIEKIGKRYGLHPLTIEDIVNTDQRPKREEMPEYLYLVLKMLHHVEPNRELTIEQVSIVLLKNTVLSFQERERKGDVFGFVRERISKGRGRMCQRGADYLCYALIDSVVDYYFVILEECGERIDTLEEQIIDEPQQDTLRRLYDLKRSLIQVRRAIWPLREVLNGLERLEHPLFEGSTLVYLRDVYDHAVQVIDMVETDREALASMLDIYLSSVGNKMNEVMKVLTIFASIFMPLTFIVGIYGMNFDHMPELRLEYGYPVVMGCMAALAIMMLLFFRMKKWL